MDAKQLKFEDKTFNVVIDKACLDAILTGDQAVDNYEKVLNEIHRVLTPEGIFINISYGVPEARLKFFQ